MPSSQITAAASRAFADTETDSDPDSYSDSYNATNTFAVVSDMFDTEVTRPGRSSVP